MPAAHKPLTAKRATNLSISADLLAQAKVMNINLSATLEQALAQILKQQQRAQWLRDNKAAMSAYNEHVDSTGVFSDGQRSF
jgi:antitoxin CcdA